jgi:ubiquinone/menaquinone biosynthesis C-methylase UbiE
MDAVEGARSFLATGRAYDDFMGRYSRQLAAPFADAAGVTAGQGQTALDVGCGPGALTAELVRRLGTAAVAATDPSPPFVAECAARHPGVDVRTGRAEALPFDSGAFDRVLAQLVLHFVGDAPQVAAEFRRVLRPGGRISLFEPIHRVSLDGPRFGIDPGPVAGLADRVEQVFRSLQPPETDPMRNFDERHLLQVFEQAGFAHLDLEYHVSVRREYRDGAWFESMLDGIGNPRIPSLRQAIASALSEDEAAAYLAHYRQAVAGSPVITRQAHVYLCGSVD